MKICDDLLRITIRKALLIESGMDRSRSWDSVRLVDGGNEVNLSSSGYTSSFDRSSSVRPAVIWNGVDYSTKITSDPQAVRTDVGVTHNVKTGQTQQRKKSAHKGYDFGMPVGTPVVSFKAGTVTKVGNDAGGGNYIKIVHDTDASSYLHLSQILQKEGDEVKPGQVIALSGDTGNITGPHLHWTYWPDGKTKSFDKGEYDSVLDAAVTATVVLGDGASQSQQTIVGETPPDTGTSPPSTEDRLKTSSPPEWTKTSVVSIEDAESKTSLGNYTKFIRKDGETGAKTTYLVSDDKTKVRQRSGKSGSLEDEMNSVEVTGAKAKEILKWFN